MKRLITPFLLIVAFSAYAVFKDEMPFTYPIPFGNDILSMSFHPGLNTNAVSVGLQEYNKPAIPADTEGELVIPDSVVFEGVIVPVCWISRGSFQSCTKLTRIQLPNKLEAISDLAFEGCTSLREITFPDSLEVIYPRAFIGCSALRRVRFLSSAPPRSYNNDTFDEATYVTATLVIPARSAKAYLIDPLCYRFRYHAEMIPLNNEVQP